MSGGGSSGSTNSTSTNVNYSPEEAAQRATVMNEATNIYNNTKGTLANSDYPGAKVAGLSTDTLAAQDTARANATAAQGTVNQLSSGINYGLNGAMDVSNNKYLQSAITAAQRTNNQNFSDAGGTLSQIRTGATDAGQYGGSRQGIAEGLAASRLAQTNSDVASTMMSNAYDKGQETFSKTLSSIPSAMEAYSTPSTLQSAVGAQNENYTQQVNDYNAAADLWKLNSQWTPLQNYANIVFGGTGSGTTSTSTSTGATRSGLSTAASAAGTGLTAASLAQQLSNY